MDILAHNFTIGQLYSRQRDIHDRFGGSRQSGISVSANYPVIFLFTGELGYQYGYRDDWDGHVFCYTGEGQNGDMVFSKGNKAIRDHIHNGKSLLLFRHLGKGRPYQFMGEFVCDTYELSQAADKQGKSREIIIFHLLDTLLQLGSPPNQIESSSFESLRKRAYAASERATPGTVKEGVRKFRERSLDVKAYVLKRANGICECCGVSAPFVKKDGSPYLEPHHIRQLSDSGLDRPDWVAAITPNCHREIHHGQSGSEKNERLLRKIQEKELLLSGALKYT